MLGDINCRNLRLGFATKARACKGAGEEGSLGITSCAPGRVGECEGMTPHTPKGVLILGVGVPVDFFEFSKNDYKGQNPMDWGVHYLIGKLLEFRCVKWACMTHLDTSNTSYG